MIKGMVSFCCVCYNHAKFVEDCIKSIQNQNYKNIEILVLDDGSKDNSVEIINKLKETSPCPMTVIAQENCGVVGANFNKLINLAQGEYVSIISCDDRWIDNTLNQRVQPLLNDDNMAFVCNSRIAEIDEKNNVSHICPPLLLDSLKNPTIDKVLELDYSKLGAYYIQGGIYRTDVVRAVGGFDEDMICDDIILRTKVARYMIANRKYKFKIFYEPSIYYRRHSNNLSDNSARQIRSVVQYLGRYWNDRKPPKDLKKWIGDALWRDFENTSKIFFPDEYTAKVVACLDANMFVRSQYGILYKVQGIKNLYQTFTYRNNNEKIKIVKLFGLTVLKYKKELKN